MFAFFSYIYKQFFFFYNFLILLHLQKKVFIATKCKSKKNQRNWFTYGMKIANDFICEMFILGLLQLQLIVKTINYNSLLYLIK